MAASAVSSLIAATFEAKVSGRDVPKATEESLDEKVTLEAQKKITRKYFVKCRLWYLSKH